jgi:hypothetical protein
MCAVYPDRRHFEFNGDQPNVFGRARLRPSHSQNRHSLPAPFGMGVVEAFFNTAGMLRLYSSVTTT